MLHVCWRVLRIPFRHLSSFARTVRITARLLITLAVVAESETMKEILIVVGLHFFFVEHICTIYSSLFDNSTSSGSAERLTGLNIWALIGYCALGLGCR